MEPQTDALPEEQNQTHILIAQELEKIRRRLVDVSRRNPLLNFKDRKISVLIVNELPDQIYLRLIDQNKTFRFVGVKLSKEARKKNNKVIDLESLDPVNQANEFLASPEDLNETDSTCYSDDRLQTPESLENLEAKLSTIFRNSRTFIEETGINSLYLAIGFLAWQEGTGVNEKINHAPLLLIPIIIERRSSKTRRNEEASYEIRWSEEEIEGNIALIEKLRSDFGIELPTVLSEDFKDDNGGFSVECYFNSVAKSISEKSTWKIVRKAWLDFFSFEKLRMFADLDPKSWPEDKCITKHPLIERFLFGNSDRKREEGENGDIENSLEVWKTPVILDADGAQMRAILDAQLGKNLVVHGPPGTGKSQTIANIIANAMGNQKSVLFVSEKLAALDVVKKRLESAGLEPFILAMHGHNAKGKTIVEDLKTRTNLKSSKNVIILDRTPDQIHSLVTQFDDYGRDLLQFFRDSDFTGWDILWEYISRREKMECLNIDLDFPPEKLNRKEYDIYLHLLDEIKALLKGKKINEVVWYGFEPIEIEINNRDKFDVAIKALQKSAQSTIEEFKRFKVLFYNDIDDNFYKLLELKAVDSQALKTPPPRQMAIPSHIASIVDSEIKDTVRQFIKGLQQFRERTRKCEEYFRDLETFHEEKLFGVINSVDSLVSFNLRDSQLRNLPAIEILCQKTSEVLKQIESSCRADESFSAYVPDRRLDIQRLANFFNLLCIKKFKNIVEKITSSLFQDKVDKIISQLKTQSEILQNQKSSLSKFFDFEKIPNIYDVNLLRTELILWDNYPLRSLSSKYRKLWKKCRFFVKGIHSHSLWLTQFLELSSFLENRKLFSENSSACEILGGLFEGDLTNWNSIAEIRLWIKEIINLCPTSKLLEEIQGSISSFLINHAACLSIVQSAEQEIANISEELTRLSSADFSIVKKLNEDSNLSSLFKDLQTLGDINSKLTTDLTPHIRDERITLEDCKLTLFLHKENISFRKWVISEDEYLQKYLGNIYHETNTDEGVVTSIVNWVEQLVSSKCPTDLLIALIENYNQEQLQRLVSFISVIVPKVEELQQELQSLKKLGSLNEKLFFHLGEKPLTLTTIQCKLQACESTTGIMEWSSLLERLRSARALGLETLIDKLEAGEYDALYLIEVFKYLFYKALAHLVNKEYPSLSKSNRDLLDKNIRRFKELDILNITHHQQGIASCLLKIKPPAGKNAGRISEYTEMGLLSNEMIKSRAFLSPRILLERAGNAIRTLKPCFMMSPLAVAKFIKPGSLEFDLIVMDEASQLKPEDCLGALARGKQVVIVGDNKQLPPSRFFDAAYDNADDSEEESGLSDVDSILDLAIKGCDQERVLMWHYRSEHESLINFSNVKCYDRKLIIFPSSQDEEKQELGVRYTYIPDGFFKAGVNPREAQVIAEEVIKYLKKHPERSLGVGTFNKAQAVLLDEEIYRLVSADSASSEAYDRARKRDKEPFFVKNLENIQGDERDVIFVSCTYGKDQESGRVFQRFGPLNSEGGWRRLNVMLSRSKKLMKVFSSLTPNEVIVNSQSSSRGLRMLRSFLEFCNTGKIKDEGAETAYLADNHYEIEVGQEIEKLGYTCTYQYGVSKYRIDIAVKSKKNSQQYILGVEFDGKAYHSRKFARDRDRLREEILNSRGWKLHRIWSTSWIKNKQEEVLNLKYALEEADNLAFGTNDLNPEIRT